jgi:TatD DNase family protein
LDDEESPRDFSEKCEAAGVSLAMLCGGSLLDSRKAAEFAAQAPRCFFAAGVHPQEAASFAGAVKDFKSFIENPKFKAVGEIGLDYHYSGESEEIQKRLFGELLDFALKAGKPAIVHCRDAEGSERAYGDTYEKLERFASRGGRFVLHCFTGTPEWADKFAKIGAYFGIAGIITFKKAEELRQTVAWLPADRLLLETDAPYLAPVPFRGKKNHPSLLPHTAKALASLRGLPEDDLAKLCRDNGKRLFSIEEPN